MKYKLIYVLNKCIAEPFTSRKKWENLVIKTG